MELKLHRWVRLCVFICGLAALRTAIAADPLPDNNPNNVRPIPPPGIEVPEADRKELEAGLAKLGTLLDELRPKGMITQPRQINVHRTEKFWDVYADVAIFHRAVQLALSEQQFYDPKEIIAAKKLLEIGLDRAAQLKASNKRWIAPWQNQTGPLVRGYISQIDQTPQPYGVVVPESFDPNKKGTYRLDVWYHGRGETLSELNFITQRLNQTGPISPPDTFVIHPYGRYCNASKFAGEIDTMEAVNALQQSYGKVGSNRIGVRGFSMGGATTWHMAVHHPDKWFAANPGAGFAETPQYLQFNKKETLRPTWWEEKLWRWYDCPGYVTNLRDLPVVAYSGEDDPQKQAADIMATAYEKEGMNLLHIIGPKTGHSIHPESAKEIEAKLQEWDPGLESRPLVGADYTTYSMIYPEFNRGRILGLKEHWEQARIQVELLPAGGVEINTRNIQAFQVFALSVTGPGKLAREQGIRIDGKLLDRSEFPESLSEHAGFTLVGNVWKSCNFEQLMELNRGRKNAWTCGPIDHAFMSSFLFVKPTGKCAHPNVQKWVDDEMNRAITQWRRFFRGDVKVVKDTDISEKDFNHMNSPYLYSSFILWGDPQSNLWIRKLADKMPIQWTDAEITVGEQKFDSANHALIAVYPNPVTGRYIVLNSGFTFREYDYLTNARQTPKLPDWAVVDLRTPPNSRWPGKIVAADFFDEEWKLKKK